MQEKIYDVTVDRHLWVGGSDIPTIMGINPFKTRWELIQEKAQTKESDFVGNEYTRFGHFIEPYILDHLNSVYCKDLPKLEETQVVNEETRERYNSDGNNHFVTCEIKSTGKVKKDLMENKNYLVQLLKGMNMHRNDNGILAIYERPSNFVEIMDEYEFSDTVEKPVAFDPERLTIFDDITITEHADLTAEINQSVKKFWEDVDRLRENPELTEEDFVPNEVMVLSNQLEKMETMLAEYNKVQAEYDKIKNNLYETMERYDVKKFTTVHGTQITRVIGTPATEEVVQKFDDTRFKLENEDLIKKYTKEVVTKVFDEEEFRSKESETYTKYIFDDVVKKNGRKGYVKITLPKGEKDNG